MKAEEILRKYGLGTQLSHQEFLQQLHRLPLFREKWLYWTSTTKHLLQGDIVGPIQLVLSSKNNRHGLLEVNAIVVSNTCNLVPIQEDFALLAPVVTISEHIRPRKKPEDVWKQHLLAIRKFEIIPYCYLPKIEGLEESFADFSRITHIPTISLSNMLSDGKVSRIASLSRKGHLLFLSKLTYFLARLESKEVSRL